MKTLLVILAAALLAGAFGFSSLSQAQDPGPDLGDVNLLALACDHAALTAAREGLSIRNCRRHEPEQVVGNRAVVSVRAVTREAGAFALTFYFQRSLWSVQSFEIVQK